ncbi:MAG: hypothetical protein ABSF72_07450 [Candidatus Sulfotelmatobacter sp.]
MKKLAIGLLLTASCFGQGARQYYKEIYDAGGLDNMADGYVCFDDDHKLETFFIFGESKTIREFMIADGTFSKMSPDLQRKLKKDFLIVRGYDKGVPIGEEDFYDRDGSSWVGEEFVLSKEPKTFGRMRFNITWETLRYKRSVEVLKPDESFSGQYARYGKCEQVSPEIRQHGHH